MGNDNHHKVEVGRVPSINKSFLELLPQEDLLRLSQKIAQRLGTTPVPVRAVPAEIFSYSLSPAEAVVKYLKESQEMNFHEIGGVLCRDERGIWGSYNRSKKKMAAPFDIAQSSQTIPIDILGNRTFSILEAVVVYLVDTCKLKFSHIAQLLNKKYSTVYTTYLRAKKKQSKGGAT